MLTKLDASLHPQAQLQDAKRRWEELQNFLHNVNAEREKLQASKQGEQIEHHTKHLILFNFCYIKNESSGYIQQLNFCLYVGSELHSQMLAAETEMNNKNKEIQTIHSSLTEAMVSKERLEQRVVELMEMSQHSMPDDALQARVQVSQHHTQPTVLKWKMPKLENIVRLRYVVINKAIETHSQFIQWVQKVWVALHNYALFLTGTHEWKQKPPGPEWEHAGPDLFTGIFLNLIYKCSVRIRLM